MVATDDFYDLLGVSRSASDSEIKSAYKKAARKFHPDNTDTGNEDMFKKVGEAYEVLKDPQKKAIYDQYGAEGLKGQGGPGGFGGFGGFGGAEGFEDLGDIFSSFFGGGFSGGGGRANRPNRGQDHRVDIKIDFMDSVKGKKKKIRFNPLIHCTACDGKGYDENSKVQVCQTCKGTGQVTTVQNTILGQIRQSSTCPDCKGKGKIIIDPCKSCNGKGVKREEKEVEVKLPAGIYDGANMRLAGMGDAGTNGGPPGDIYLVIHVDSHPLFQREGDHIYSEFDIDFSDAALGTSYEVETVHGKKKLEVKAGTQNDQVYVLKNEGMPKINNPARFGNHNFIIKVKVPEKLSSKEKKLLEEYRELRRSKK